jgi:hypothetical protein
MMRLLVAVLFGFSMLYAQDKAVQEKIKPVDPGRTMWLVSVGALTVANITDAQSSWNKHELNGGLGRITRGGLVYAAL